MTVGVRMVERVLEGVRATGLESGPLLRDVGIAPGLLAESGVRVPVESFMRLSIEGIFRTGDEMLGLLPRPMRPGSFRAMARHAIHARTLGEALGLAAELFTLFDNGLAHEVRSRGAFAEYALSRLPGQLIRNGFAIYTMLVTQHRFASWLVGERVPLHEVTFDFPPPDDPADFARPFYRAPARFGRDRSALRFDRAWLGRPLVRGEAALEELLESLQLGFFFPAEWSGTLTGRIRNLVFARLRRVAAPPSLREAAEHVHLHPQTLRRRLEREGSGLHAIVAQVRREIAVHHLGNDTLSVEEIADRTGYSEPSAFIRAFKAWTGMTPAAFRRRNDAVPARLRARP